MSSILITSLVIILPGYLLLVRLLRFRRLHEAQARFRALKAEGKLTPTEAQKIAHTGLLYDLPFLSRLGASIALFKTYGIPTVARLLTQTGQMTMSSHIMSKRSVDTAILISTFIMFPLGGDETDQDPRGPIALARVNWLHRRYRISNDDMLYTLALFIFEPVRFVEKFDWRGYSSEERECLFIMWKEIGRRMDIQDIPDTEQELEEWSLDYERKHMVPTESSHKLAEGAIEHLSNRLPDIGLRSVVKNLAIALLDDRLREAMMLPKPPAAYTTVINIIFCTRAWIVKNLFLPRTLPHGFVKFDSTPSSTDLDGLLRVHTFVRRYHPWYYSAPTGWRYHLDQFKMSIGLGDPTRYPGPQYKSEGYRLEEMGPSRYENEGHAEVFMEAASWLGSPISKPWAR